MKDFTDDRTLIREIKNGNNEAFEFLFNAYYSRLRRYAIRFVRDEEVVRDIIQESFLKFWEKRALIKPDSNLRSWVYTIARNRTLNALKEKKLFSDNSVRDTIDERVAALEDPSMEHFIDSLELISLIRKAFETLPDTSEDTFRLSRIAGLTNREIAERKGISVKSVEYHIKISLRHFRKKLKEYLPEGKKY